ncbi:hypothetical protein BKA70DRAFT_1223595 [Coprinopsis sp. MPI-PUGE-AT-0042]|nr:hypothetical protein BKA70DRAFT_1223595 [Coprinopsis sp. MPI-PUGE-AT-0042]
MDAVVGGGMVGNAKTSVTAKRGLQDLEEMRRRIMGASEEEEVSKCFPELELAEKRLTMEVAYCGDERFNRSRSRRRSPECCRRPPHGDGDLLLLGGGEDGEDGGEGIHLEWWLGDSRI